MRKTLYFIYFTSCLILVVGLFFHSSFNRDVFIYSYKYFALISGLALALLFAVPYIFTRLLNKHGAKNLSAAILPSLAVLVLAYIFFHYRYYYTQQHPFDPYVQIGINDKIDPNEDADLVILALGGSTTMNQNVDENYRYPTVLKERLASAFPEKKISVINAGMFWYTSRHSLINYHSYYKKINPDVVIIMHSINDIYRSFTPPDFCIDTFRSDYSHFYGASINGANPPTFEGPLFKLLGRYWFSVFRKSKAVPMDISDFKSFPSYKEYMSTLIKDVIDDSAKCYILEQPSMYKAKMSQYEQSLLLFGKTLCTDGDKHPDIPSLMHAMAAYNYAAHSLADSLGASFIPTEAEIKKNTEHFIDDVHYTNLASKKLGELVFNQLLKDNILSN